MSARIRHFFLYPTKGNSHLLLNQKSSETFLHMEYFLQVKKSLDSWIVLFHVFFFFFIRPRLATCCYVISTVIKYITQNLSLDCHKLDITTTPITAGKNRFMTALQVAQSCSKSIWTCASHDMWHFHEMYSCKPPLCWLFLNMAQPRIPLAARTSSAHNNTHRP
jgi:hypothetical protein